MIMSQARKTNAFLLITMFAFAAVSAESPFDSDTGLRIHHYTDPVPETVPGGVTLNTEEVASLLNREDVVSVDVISINDVRYDELDGSWPDYPKRNHIKGSLWLPNVGYGRPAQDMLKYLISHTTEAVAGNLEAPVMIYCVSDCWMGWNAVRHLAKSGFKNLYWYPEGTDGWIQAGYPVVLAEPVPVNVD